MRAAQNAVSQRKRDAEDEKKTWLDYNVRSPNGGMKQQPQRCQQKYDTIGMEIISFLKEFQPIL